MTQYSIEIEVPAEKLHHGLEALNQIIREPHRFDQELFDYHHPDALVRGTPKLDLRLPDDIRFPISRLAGELYRNTGYALGVQTTKENSDIEAGVVLAGPAQEARKHGIDPRLGIRINYDDKTQRGSIITQQPIVPGIDISLDLGQAMSERLERAGDRNGMHGGLAEFVPSDERLSFAERLANGGFAVSFPNAEIVNNEELGLGQLLVSVDFWTTM